MHSHYSAEQTMKCFQLFGLDGLTSAAFFMMHGFQSFQAFRTSRLLLNHVCEVRPASAINSNNVFTIHSEYIRDDKYLNIFFTSLSDKVQSSMGGRMALEIL